MGLLTLQRRRVLRPVPVAAEELDQIEWGAVSATDFREAHIREGKQAEFLVHGSFPWELVQRIGVQSRDIVQQVANAMHGATHRPPVELRPDWYY